MNTHKEKNTIIKEKFKSVGSGSLDSKKRITLGNKIMKEIPLNHMEVDKFEIFVAKILNQRGKNELKQRGQLVT